MQQWLSVLDVLLAKHRYIRRDSILLLPSDETEDFLERLAALVEEMETLLRDPARCRFVPMTLAKR
jgi:hypothetical protein